MVKSFLLMLLFFVSSVLFGLEDKVLGMYSRRFTHTNI